MKNQLKFILSLVTIIVILTGCYKPENEFGNSPELNGYYPENVDKLILGQELEDPYAIHNIYKAYANLKSAGFETPVTDLKPNHIYLRFLPKNDDEWNILKQDSTLILYDYPLNYEITQSGSFFHDPSMPDSLNWQYSVVPVNKALPAIEHEVIYEVFIPPDADSTNKNASIDMIQFYEALEKESARLTGNLPADEKSDNDVKGLLPSKWTPKGTIRVWDDLLRRFIPLAYVNVHARWFTHIKADMTDENGYFQTGSFRYTVNYAIKWETSHYTIRNGMFLQAWYNGPRRKGDWNLDIKGGESVMYATIHRAAYKQFYGDNLGISRPVLKDGSRTKICYRDCNGRAEFWGDWSSTGILPDIQIWGKSNDIYKTTNKIFGNTTHELGHQSHSQYVGNIKYYKISKIIRESWADAVEWAISNDEYHNLGRKYGITSAINYNHTFNTHNRWPFVEDKSYSPIFIDLMDKINQRISLGPEYPNDLISAYNLQYINFYLLENSSGLVSLHEAVRNHKLSDVNDFQIEELFALYNKALE